MSKAATPLRTPAGSALRLPTRALAEAVAEEWQQHGRFSAAKMPLTSLAYTAIDRIEGQKENIAEALLAFLDTDTLSHRASTQEKLFQRQKEQWDPILAWAEKTFGATWQLTQGVMPMDQPPALHDAIRRYLLRMDSMRLAAGCLLASLFSSLALALATLAGQLDTLEAFRLSRLEEDYQAEQWGEDSEAVSRAARLREEAAAVKRFLRLLEAA
ncbi:MAG: ATPase [Pseudomonadota bacterium]|nr:ATPase [Pseudomonadota bacterium]